MKFTTQHIFYLLCGGAFVLWLIAGPTGSWSGIYWTMAAISLTSFYGAFCSGAGGFSKTMLAAVCCIFMLGTIGVAGRVSTDQGASKTIAKYIKPYPNIIAQKAVTTRLPSRNAHAWVLTTIDEIPIVREFYDDEKNYPGWEKSNQITRIILKRGKDKIEISLQRSGKETYITYLISS